MDRPSEELLRSEREQEARRERIHQAGEALRFRSIRDRDVDDQAEAARRGYDSVEQLAIDELGKAYHALEERVSALEGRA